MKPQSAVVGREHFTLETQILEKNTKSCCFEAGTQANRLCPEKFYFAPLLWSDLNAKIF